MGDVFENVWKMRLKIHHLNPVKSLSAPGLAWRAALKKSKVKLKLLTDIKGAEATLPKILAKNSNTLGFYSNLYLTFPRSCCENIFKIELIVSEKIRKEISQFIILFLASIRSSLQFHWNRKYFSSAILRLRDRLFMVPWHGFHLFDKER